MPNNTQITLEDYLREFQHSFADEPFNEVDSLVLSSLVYLNFEEYDLADASASDPVPLIDVLRFTDSEALIGGSWMKSGDDVGAFLTSLARCRRFKNLGVQLFLEESSTSIDKQFCAATFTAQGMPTYVAFRGTDGTLAGWKEDFNLAYMDVLPSHRSALRYLSGTLSSLPADQRINVGGHSKGGNLAEYAAACIDDAGFARIEAIYNHDGPAFLNNPSPRYATEEYRAKRNKTIPESSIFGMILEHESDHRIVQSTASTVFQHRPLTWLVDGAHFAYQEDLNQSARFFDTSLDGWLRSCSPEQREVFLNTVFDLAKSTDAESWQDFKKDMPQNLPKLIRETRQLDPETRDVVQDALMRLGDQLKENTKDYLSDRFSQMKEKLPKIGDSEDEE